MLILLLLFLLIVQDFSQLPDEFCQCLHVMVAPFQQFVAKTGDVLFDLFQFTCGAVSKMESKVFFLLSDLHIKSMEPKCSAELTFIHLIIIFIPLCFKDKSFDEAIHNLL